MWAFDCIAETAKEVQGKNEEEFADFVVWPFEAIAETDKERQGKDRQGQKQRRQP